MSYHPDLMPSLARGHREELLRDAADWRLSRGLVADRPRRRHRLSALRVPARPGRRPGTPAPCGV